MSNTDLIVRQLGLQDYQEIWHKMQEFTDNRMQKPPMKFWLVEHHPVSHKAKLANRNTYYNAVIFLLFNRIVVVKLPYHGPGQQVNVCAH